MKRRAFLGAVGALPILAEGAAAQARSRGAPAVSAPRADEGLRLRADGTFKILAISDLHYIPAPDPHGLALTEKLIDLEQPDLVVVNGDNISGDRCANLADIEASIANVAQVMEQKRVPWVVVLGNHDQDHFAKTGIPRDQAFDIYSRYPHNINKGWVRDISGAGNKNFLLWDAEGRKPEFNLWLLDSGGPSPDRAIRYEWVLPDQVAWYWRTSRDLEARFGAKIPGLMFFHIPLPEFREMILTRKVIGERHEPESPSAINGGLFGAALNRGDVMGMFCGHDHVNNYVGRFHGVTLGQVGVVGYYGYPHTPPEDVTNDRARGARVFLLDKNKPNAFRTWMRFRDGSVNWEHWSDAYVEVEQK